MGSASLQVLAREYSRARKRETTQCNTAKLTQPRLRHGRHGQTWQTSGQTWQRPSFDTEHVSITGGSCHKYHFVFCRDKIMFVTTKKLLPRNMLRDTSIFLSREKTCFVATKIILVAAPANDT